MPSIKRSVRPYNKVSQHDPYYDTPNWRRKRRSYFSQPENRFCKYCEARGVATIAFILDHQLSRKLFPELEDDPKNFKGSCRICDQKKRQIESQCFDRITLIKKLSDAGFYP